MDSTLSEGVLHGPRTWIDYDRPWILRRQLLISQYHASIISNLVAMALTLAGPRLWILIKAFGFWIYDLFIRRRLRANSAYPAIEIPHSYLLEEVVVPQSRPRMVEILPLRHNRLLSENILTTEESRSEIGAARDILRNAWDHLRTDHIELSVASQIPKISKLWKNLISQPMDVMISLSLSLVLIALFVAESSGSVMSAYIVSDNVALAATPKCSMLYRPRLSTAPEKDNYVEILPELNRMYKETWSRRTHAYDYAAQCYNKSGADGCNFLYRQRIPYTEISSNVCPFAGERCARVREAAHVFDTGVVDANALGINVAKGNIFRRITICSPLLTESRISTDDYEYHNYFGCHYSHMYSEDFLTRNRSFYRGTRTEPAAKHCPQALNYSLLHKPLDKVSKVSFFNFNSPGVEYSEYRDDPIFPAKKHSPWSGSPRHSNNSTSPGVLACIDTVILANTVLGAFAQFTPDKSLDQPYFEYGDSNPVTEAQAAFRLLYIATAGSPLSLIVYEGRMEVFSHCVVSRESTNCHQLPQDQWVVEARRMFEASLALMQLTVHDIVRGTINPREDYQRIPPNYRAICGMGKFRSVGWRNVSVWGLIGLLFLAGAISIASVKNENGELWLVKGLQYLFIAAQWIIEGVKALPWARFRRRLVYRMPHFQLLKEGIRRMTAAFNQFFK